MVCSPTRIWSMPRSREPEDIFSEPSAKAPYRKWSPYFPPYRIQHLLSTVCRCQRNGSWTRDFAIFLFAYCYVSNIASTHNLIHIHMNDNTCHLYLILIKCNYIQVPLLLILTLTLAPLRIHTHYKVWHERAYPFPNLNITGHGVTYPSWDHS